MAREEYGLAGAVQHGASTLPANSSATFADHDCAEIHLATEFQNMVFDHPAFPLPLKRAMERWLSSTPPIRRRRAKRRTSSSTGTRKQAVGPFKEQVWNLPPGTREAIRGTLEKKFAFLFEMLRVTDTRDVVAQYVDSRIATGPVASRRLGSARGLRPRRRGGRLKKTEDREHGKRGT